MHKKHIIVGSILVIGAIMVGSSLAWWTWSTSSNEQTNVVVTVGGITIDYEDGENITNNNLIPTSTKEQGISKDITVSSTGQVYLDLNMEVITLDDGLKDASFKYEIYNGNELIKGGNFASNNAGDNIALLSGVTANSTPTTYTLYIWIDGNMSNPNTMYNQNFEFRLNASATDETPDFATQTLERLGLTVNEGLPDFDQIATTDEGLFAAQDDYGTSYYFRGAVDNNYVYFANKYWRIIRINGDGSIRMIYDGTVAHANGESSEDRQIGTSAYNNNFNDNAYVGYMYGQIGASTYEETHANTNDSTIKTVVDNWYKTNILDTGYEEYLADVIYCDDRKLENGGYGTVATYYESWDRFMRGSLFGYNPVLTCSQKNDRFTVSDTSKGNGVLTYPVGLITADELALAGGKYNTGNNNYYLYTGNYFWTMSSALFVDGHAGSWAESGYTGSYVGIYMQLVDNIYGVRPVISLKPSVELTGSGTMEDPWIVQ